jgi:ubiquinone/menaquinone biosynthesis C-methylase UbiE
VKLNRWEKLLMHNPGRAALQRGVVAWMKAHGGLAPAGVVLEIGCGRGFGLGLVARAFRPRAIVGLDLDEAMLDLARQRPAGPEAGLVQGRADRLPVRDQALDAVFGFGFLHHVRDWRQALAEIGRVLRPAGLYFLEEYYPQAYNHPLVRRILLHPQEDRFRGPELAEGLDRAGLQVRARVEVGWLGIWAVAARWP